MANKFLPVFSTPQFHTLELLQLNAPNTFFEQSYYAFIILNNMARLLRGEFSSELVKEKQLTLF